MKYKTASFLSIALTIFIFIAAPLALVIFADPYQIYHKSFFDKVGYSREQVYQHAGWINRLLADPQQNYQSIVIGSSVMANFAQPLFDEKMPSWGKVLNLSINGSVPIVQAAVAKYALLKNPDIKNILWDIHFLYVLDEPDHLEFPYYLYNEKKIDDGEYLFNATNLISSIKFIKGDFSGFTDNIKDNGPFYESLLAAGLFDKYKSIDLRKTLLPALQSAPTMSAQDEATIASFQYPEVEKYLLDIIFPFCNADKELVITFSPPNRYWYAMQEDMHFLYMQFYMRRYILERTSACKNVKVFAFDNVDWISGNITNYADYVHYNIAVNSYMLESIATGRHRLTSDNIGEYEEGFIRAVNGYRKQFADELTAMEKAAAKKPASK